MSKATPSCICQKEEESVSCQRAVTVTSYTTGGAQPWQGLPHACPSPSHHRVWKAATRLVPEQEVVTGRDPGRTGETEQRIKGNHGQEGGWPGDFRASTSKEKRRHRKWKRRQESRGRSGRSPRRMFFTSSTPFELRSFGSAQGLGISAPGS